MNRFLSTVIASTLGTLIGLFIAGFLFISTFFILGTVASFMLNTAQEIKTSKKDSSVLYLDLSSKVFESLSFEKALSEAFEGQRAFYTISDIEVQIKNAKSEKSIKGIYLKFDGLSLSWSSLKRLQGALLDFKKSKKFIVSYAYGLDKKSYLLASVADKIVIYPEGIFNLSAYNISFISIKNLLHKLKIGMYTFRTGKYKSAIEPLIQEKISQENAEQLKELVSHRWAYFVSQISREKDIKTLDKIATEKQILSGKEAKQYQLVDFAQDEWFAYRIINKALGLKVLDQKPPYFEYKPRIWDIWQTLISKWGLEKQPHNITSQKKQDTIAILELEGQITDSVHAERYSIQRDITLQTLRRIRKNKNVKALVIRMNSPGGSASASDMIWNEVHSLAQKIPVVVSVSDVAASGGYYIASAAHHIIAEPTSIVGSIGVFAIRPYLGAAMKWLGIESEVISSHPQTPLFELAHPLDKVNEQRISNIIKQFYDRFKEVIQKSRKISSEQVEQIATGRIWHGEKAKQLRLIDEIGTFNDAIDKATALAKLKKPHIQYYYPSNTIWSQSSFQTALKTLLKNFIPHSLSPTHLMSRALLITKLSKNNVLALPPYLIEFSQ